MNRKIIFLLLPLLFGMVNLHSQIQFASMEEVWAYADTQNIQIRKAEAGQKTAGISRKQSISSLLPSITLNGSYTDNIELQPTLIPADLFNPAAPPGTYSEATFGRRFIYTGALVAQYELINTKNWFAVKSARISEEMAAIGISADKLTLYEQLANAYYSCLWLQEAEVLISGNLETANQSFEIASNKYKEGLLSEVSYNTALINKKRTENTLESTRTEKSIQLNALKSLLNTNESITLTEKLVTTPVGTDNRITATDPRIQLAYKNVQLAETNWKASKAAHAPSVSLIYQYNLQIAGDEFLKFKSSNTLPQQYFGVRLSIPVYAGKTKKYQIQKAQIDYALRKEEYENTKKQADLNDQNLLATFNSSLTTYKKAGEILDLYKKNDLHAARKLEEGILSLDQRLSVYSDLVNYQNEFLQHLYNLLIQQYRLKIRQTNFGK